MKLNYLLIFLILLFLTQIDLFSQSRLYPKHQIGLGFSSLSGGVVSYQIELNPAEVFKFGSLVYYTSERPPDELVLYGNFGFEYQYNFIKNISDRFYALGGLSYWYYQDKSFSETKINDVTIIKIDNNIKRILNFGVGIGYEFKIHPQAAVNFDIELLNQLRINGEGNFDKFFDRIQNDNFSVGLSFGFGIRYAF